MMMTADGRVKGQVETDTDLSGDFASWRGRQLVFDLDAVGSLPLPQA